MFSWERGRLWAGGIEPRFDFLAELAGAFDARDELVRRHVNRNTLVLGFECFRQRTTRHPEPRLGLDQILFHAFTEVAADAEVVLRVGVTLLSGHAKPLGRFYFVLGHAQP